MSLTDDVITKKCTALLRTCRKGNLATAGRVLGSSIGKMRLYILQMLHFRIHNGCRYIATVGLTVVIAERNVFEILPVHHFGHRCVYNYRTTGQ